MDVPALDAEVLHLERPAAPASALHRLVAAELARRDGETLWIDARGDASTHALYDAAQAPHHLDGVRVARAFTAHQHHALVRRAVERVSPRTSLLVVPCTAARYRDEDVPEHVGSDLLASSLATLGELASACEASVLVTTPGEGTAAEALVAEYADRTVTCRATDVGLRFDGEDVETTVYRADGAWQTTLPYWVDLFGCVCDADGPAVTGPAPTTVEG